MKMTAYAQVMLVQKDERLIGDCPYCEKEPYRYQINGRSPHMTRTHTTYTCAKCLAKAIDSMELIEATQLYAAYRRGNQKVKS